MSLAFDIYTCVCGAEFFTKKEFEQHVREGHLSDRYEAYRRA